MRKVLPFSPGGGSSPIHGRDAGATLKWPPASHGDSVERDPKVPFRCPIKRVRYGSVIALECGSLLPLCPARPDQLAGRASMRSAWAGEVASRLAGRKRQQAAALQTRVRAYTVHDSERL
jgi:hypothetical protein